MLVFDLHSKITSVLLDGEVECHRVESRAAALQLCLCNAERLRVTYPWAAITAVVRVGEGCRAVQHTERGKKNAKSSSHGDTRQSDKRHCAI
jgi:hypothetical protein